MEFRDHFNQVRNLLAQPDDWDNRTFSWKKAYICSVFSRLAYEVVPEFELKKSKRAKIIPCDGYQAHVSRWESSATVPSLARLDLNIPVEIVIRRHIIVTITRINEVIFIAMRGTTLCFSDVIADIDCRKIDYGWGFSAKMQMHHGFFDAVLECFDEVVEKVRSLVDGRPKAIYITGHSLGGAMAAVLNARLAEADYHPRFRPRIYGVPDVTSCYTFGMPRYQDGTAKAILPQPYHIFNELDVIPTLPPTILGFADVPNERCLNAVPELANLHAKGNLPFRSKSFKPSFLGISDHRMERYLERLDAMRLCIP
jgi:hypothetical protein